MEYRNELKFEVSESELTKMKYRLLPLMRCDSHQDTDGYAVRSLYFDDIYDSCMKEKGDGVCHRIKYRLRIYNADAGLVRLEKKIKCRQMTKKVSQTLTRGESDALLRGDREFPSMVMAGGKESLLRELAAKMVQKNMAPKCIVEYDRFAFVEAAGNVRITFDRNVSGCGQVERFYDEALFQVPVMPAGRHILEIKFDEFLPRYILQAADLGNLRRQSFSKYYFARAAVG